METYYDILEIEESATPEEIKQAYRLLLEVWHPDRFHHKPKLLAKAEQKSGKINKAFETLGTPELKQQYDARPARHRFFPIPSDMRNGNSMRIDVERKKIPKALPVRYLTEMSSSLPFGWAYWQ